jgi:hypothetical protein
MLIAKADHAERHIRPSDKSSSRDVDERQPPLAAPQRELHTSVPVNV